MMGGMMNLENIVSDICFDQMKIQNGIKDESVFECTPCTKVFKSRESLKFHEKRTHLEKNMDKTEKRVK